MSWKRRAAVATATSRHRLIVAVLTLASAALLAFATAPAFAVTTHVFAFSFGTAGAGAGQVSLASNSGLAVNATTHDIYVADTGNARVDQFDQSGSFIRAWGFGVADGISNELQSCTLTCFAGLSGSAPGQFTTPTFIAVDNSAGASKGDVYVADTANNVVTKFDASGSLIAAWGSGGQLDGSTATDGPFNALNGITVDTSGSLWVYGTNGEGTGRMFQFAQDSTFTQDWDSGRGVNPGGIDADSAGNLYVLTGGGSVEQFSATGTDVGGVNGDAGEPTGFTIDRSNDELYMDAGGTAIRHYDSSCDAGGNCTATDTFGFGDLSGAAGLAVDPSNHTVFAADSGHQRIAVFTGPVALPDATTNPASSVAKHSATLNGQVDPAGAGDITDCRFEYTDEATFQAQGYTAASTIACDRATPISSATAVTASPTGLDPGTTYHFRLLAANANGEIHGEDQTFTTEPAVNLTIAEANPISATTATLNGHVDSNGGGDITDCHFEYTDEASFQSNGFTGAQSAPCTPAAPISSPTDVSAEIAGLSAATTYHVRLLATNADGTTATGDQPFTTIAAVLLEIFPANPIGATTATFNGHVDSNGGGDITDCHFEYTDDASFQSNGFSGAQSAPCTPATPISSPTDVSADVSGLTAETTYHVRLVATNSFGTSQTGDQPFSTLPRPHIDFAAAQNLTETEADLVAKINPEGFDTTYHFEWGEADCASSPCTSVPVPDADIGSGSSDVSVSTHLTGLTANRTYHWRVIATSANGTVGAEADHTFIYDTSGQGLPDNRAYEQVTPVEKNGALLGSGLFTFLPTVADDGSRLTSTSIQCFADAVSCNASRGRTGSLYGFTRSPSGWVTHQIALPSTQFTTSSSSQVTPDSGAGLFSAPTAPGGEDDFYLVYPDGSFSDIGPVTPPADGPQGEVTPDIATPDFSHVVFQADHPLWPFDTSTGRSLYQYSGIGNSQPSLVGVAGGQGATDLISACGTQFPSDAPGPVATDGTVYFLALGQDDGECKSPSALPTDQLYARIDGTGPSAHTVAISQRSPADCGVPSGCQGSAPGDAHFEGASADGSRAFFTSTQQLTDAASEDDQPGDSAVIGVGQSGCTATTGPNGCSLYLYDFSKPAGEELTAVSAGDTSGDGPNVQGVFAVSRDGSRVYFVAKGVLAGNLDANGHGAQFGDNNLYGYDANTGATSFIAVLPDSDSGLWTLSTGAGTAGFGANVTPDGRFLVFPSRGNLTPDDTSRSGARQIFRYDAQTGVLIRISVGNDGFSDKGNRSGPTPCGFGFCAEDAAIPARTPDQGPRTDPTMSHDGADVFFMSPVALTAHALDDVPIGTSNRDGVTPDYAQNVYEWHAGHVYLISDGRDASRDGGQTTLCASASPVCLIAADGSGQNVFFSTADQLVPQDSDTSLDYYDARVGGGFPFTPPPVPCNGENCKPPPSASPTTPSAATVSFSGPGNARPGAAPAKVKILSRVVHGARFLLTVNVPGRGSITISGAGIQTAKKSVSKAGTYKLRVKLTAKEKRLLKHKRRLKLKLRVSFTPPGGASSAVTFSITDKA
jgi:sugar lactone lactonase YvrE